MFEKGSLFSSPCRAGGGREGHAFHFAYAIDVILRGL